MKSQSHRDAGKPPRRIRRFFEVLESRRMLAFHVDHVQWPDGSVDLVVSLCTSFPDDIDVLVCSSGPATELSLEIATEFEDGAYWIKFANGYRVRQGEVDRVVVRGSSVNDVIDANSLSAPLVVHGNEGGDVITGGLTSNKLYGDGGDDQLIGGNNPGSQDGTFNELAGGSGCDMLQGGQGHDLIYDDTGRCEASESGHNELNGAGGSDEIILDLTMYHGRAVATGGDGKDVFHVYSHGGDADNSQVFVDAGTGDDEVNFWIPQEPLQNPDFAPGTGRDSLHLFLPQNGGNDISLASESDELMLRLNERAYVLPAFEAVEFSSQYNKELGDNFTIGDVEPNISIFGSSCYAEDPDRACKDFVDARQYKQKLVVWAGWGDDTVLGGAGDDFIVGEYGNDILKGGEGSDAIWGDKGEDHVSGEGGDDFLFGLVDFTLPEFRGYVEYVEPEAEGIRDYLDGGPGNDVLQGGDGDDELMGGSDDDQLYGFWNLENVACMEDLFPPAYFLDGDDVYVFDSSATGKDSLAEYRSADTTSTADTLDFEEFDSPVLLDLADISEQSLKPGLSMVLNRSDLFENVIGSPLSDRIRGNSRVNHLEGRGGSDILIGEGDDGPELGQGDWLEGGADGDVLLGDGFELDTTAWAALVANFSTFLASGNLAFGIELNPTGSGGDVLDGGDGDALIIGGAGNDAINAGVGRALIFGDTFSFNLGSEEPFAIGLKGVIDNLSLSSFLFTDGGGFSLVGNGNDLIHGGNAGNAILGGGGDDWIWGSDNSPADFLFGNDGEDHVFGGNGFNFVVGGAGDDPELVGGGGFDIIIGDSLEVPDGAMVTSPAAASLIESSSILRQLADLFGFAEVNEEGAPQFYDTAFDFKIVDTGDDVIQGGNGVNLLFGGSGDDDITGGNKEDVIYGGLGDDAISGMNGVDLLVGGLGDDTLLGGNDTEPNFLFGDVVTVDASFDLSPFFTGDLTKLTFPKLSIKLLGAGSDTISGGLGFDLIVGGNGADELRGQIGDDTSCADIETCKNHNLVFGDDFSAVTAVIDFAADLINPVKSAVASLVVNIVKSAVIDLYNKLFDVEGQLPLENGDTYHGGDGHDIALGGDGEDHLFGHGGSDFLIGGAGKDFVDVGSAPDKNSLYGVYGDLGWGGTGDDEFYGGNGNDVLASDQGTDKFFGGDGDDVLSGGGDDDVLFGENGDDWLYGEGENDLLDGGPGADKLFGGPGDDTFVSDLEDEIDDPVDRLPGDTNSDGRVDLVDLNNVRNNFGAAGPGVLGDANDDGRVDLQDLNAVRNNFGANGSGTPMLRKRVEAVIAENREQTVLNQSRLARNDRRVGSRVDELVFGGDGVIERPLSVVGSRLPGAIRHKAFRRT